MRVCRIHLEHFYFPINRLLKQHSIKNLPAAVEQPTSLPTPRNDASVKLVNFSIKFHPKHQYESNKEFDQNLSLFSRNLQCDGYDTDLFVRYIEY